MCIICIEYKKGHLTSREAMRATGEYVFDDMPEEKLAHILELQEEILKDMIEEDKDER